MLLKKIVKSALVSAIVMAGAVHAAWTVDSEGYGFVGKGDVQLIYGWNNKALQDNANNVMFRLASATQTVYEWTCDRDAGPQTQERANTTTFSAVGLLSTVARERNQITGFILSGYDGEPQIVDVSDGPAVGSCPQFWTAINLTEVTTDLPGLGFQVSIGDGTWHTLPVPAL